MRSNLFRSRRFWLAWLCLPPLLFTVGNCVDTTPSVAQGPAVLTPKGTGGHNDPSILTHPYVVLVSFDGFRSDYLDRFETPSFDRLARAGVRAEGLISVFPSLTFPGHYSIATGLYPEHHGIVGNRFYDPVRTDEFNYRDSDDARDGSWWGGEPIWVTAETQGMVAAAFFFPGTEATIANIRPTDWRPYDASVANAERVRQVINWLTRPADRRPHLVTLYFSLVDRAGHDLGPDTPGMSRAVEGADRLLGQLMDGLNTLPHSKEVSLIVVSDHGMAPIDPERQIVVRDLVDLKGVKAVATGPTMSLHVGDDQRSHLLRDTLNGQLVNARAYLRAEIPVHLHHRASQRIGDVVVIPDEGVQIRFQRDASPPAGMHGWDPTLPSMHGILLASGPRIRAGQRIPAVERVHVYPLMANLLDLVPNPNIDGDLNVLIGILKVPVLR